MSFWRFKLLEFAVGGATGIALIPVVLLIGALLSKAMGREGGSAIMIGIGFVWLVATLVLSNLFTAKLAKRWSR